MKIFAVRHVIICLLRFLPKLIKHIWSRLVLMTMLLKCDRLEAEEIVVDDHYMMFIRPERKLNL